MKELLFDVLSLTKKALQSFKMGATIHQSNMAEDMNLQ